MRELLKLKMIVDTRLDLDDVSQDQDDSRLTIMAMLLNRVDLAIDLDMSMNSTWLVEIHA